MLEPRGRRRPGFTLIELLVVISIIGLLLGLTFLVGGALFRSDKATRAAATVQSTLQIAKQMALRDRVVYGVRLVPDGNGNFNGLEYISVPPDYVSNRYRTSVDGTGNFITNGIEFDPAYDITGGQGVGSDRRLWPIQEGDFIQTEYGNQPRRIVRVGPRPGNPGAGIRPLPINEIELASPSSHSIGHWSTDFRVMRSARPVAGEEIVKLPDDVIIDPVLVSASGIPLPADPLTGHVDILFAPGQGVVGAASRQGRVVLWVRDVNNNVATSKDQTLIVVYTRSGVVSSYPVDTSSGNPLSFLNDPRPTGQ